MANKQSVVADIASNLCTVAVETTSAGLTPEDVEVTEIESLTIDCNYGVNGIPDRV